MSDNMISEIIPHAVYNPKDETYDLHLKVKLENKNLHEVCKYLSKWYNVNIIIDPALPDDQSYTFTLHDQSLEDIIRIMSNISSINYYFTEDNTLMITL